MCTYLNVRCCAKYTCMDARKEARQTLRAQEHDGSYTTLDVVSREITGGCDGLLMFMMMKARNTYKVCIAKFPVVDLISTNFT